MVKSYIGIFIISFSFLSCAAYEAREVQVKSAYEYSNKLTLSDLTVAVDSYDNPVEAESAFYVDLTEKNIRPVLIITNNKSNYIYFIKRDEIRLKDSDGNVLVPVSYEHVFELFDANEILHSMLWGIWGGLSAAEANEKMKADWQKKELPEEFIINSNSPESGFVFFESEENIANKIIVIKALNIKTDEILTFELQVL